MIKSMTGYGQGVVNHSGLTITTEIKSLNHRYLDIFVRLPRGFGKLEIDIKKYLKSSVSRGRLETLINFEHTDDYAQTLDIDYNMAKQYHQCLNKLNNALGIDDNVSLQDLLKFGDFIKTREYLSDDEIWSITKDSLDLAIEKLQDMREREGLLISKDIRARLESIGDHLQVVSQRIPVALNEYRSYLQERLKDVFQKELPDECLDQEMIIYAEKSDVTEEKVRLEIHLQQMMDMLNHDGPVGRKMDFLVQELYREVNTLGSKAIDIPITDSVLDIKSELEKIREQIQNIE